MFFYEGLNFLTLVHWIDNTNTAMNTTQMAAHTLPRIISPALLSFIHGHPKLPLHSWYFIAGVTLSVLNRPDEISSVFKYAIEKGGDRMEASPGHDEKMKIARKMREALVKAAPIGGLPKVSISSTHKVSIKKLSKSCSLVVDNQ